MNQKVGGYIDIPCPLERWTLSADSDVAVTRLASDPTLKLWAYDLGNLAYPPSSSLEIGQDVFMTGLFTPHPGVNSVDALVRTGRVAREKTTVTVTVDLETNETCDVEADLIEARAWGGESGSPVFAYQPKPSFDLEEVTREIGSMVAAGYSYPRDIKVKENAEPYLVGFLHGHFVLSDAEESNAGIAIVIPAKNILATLMDPALVADREASAKAADEKLKGKTEPS